MIEHISEESNRLLKRKILVLKQVFEKLTELLIPLNQLPHDGKNPSERTHLGQIAIDIPLVRMLMQRSQKLLDDSLFQNKGRFFSGLNRQIHRKFGKIIREDQLLHKFPEREKVIIALQKFKHKKQEKN